MSRFYSCASCGRHVHEVVWRRLDFSLSLVLLFSRNCFIRPAVHICYLTGWVLQLSYKLRLMTEKNNSFLRDCGSNKAAHVLCTYPFGIAHNRTNFCLSLRRRR